MIAEILANAVGGILSEVLGSILKQPIKQILEERNTRRDLIAAVKRAEERFVREYRGTDAELTDALCMQTRFADVPSVQSALKEILIHPFHNQTEPISTLQRSFIDVLPARVDRVRVDAAVSTFLHYLGQEVLYIPQLQQLYALSFQKVSAESNRSIASNTAALVKSVQDLRADIRQLPVALPSPVLLNISERSHEHLYPWHNLPRRTYLQFIGREAELHKLTQLMLPYPRSRHFLITLDGIGGVGKSALALELAYRYHDNYRTMPPEERFEAIIWISAKRTLLIANGIQHRQQTFSVLNDLLREIATVLELTSIMQVEVEHRRGLVEHALTSNRVLLIVDNLETVDDEEVLTFLRELPEPTKAIVTTRHRIDIAYAFRLTGMPHIDALTLIELEAASKNLEIPTNFAEDLYRRTGGIPLAIVWSIGLMSLGYDVESVLRRLGSGHSDIAHFCFSESVARIRMRDAYRLLLSLALFESSVNRKMLGAVAGLADDEIGRDDALAELLQLSLVNQTSDRFSLLPLTRSFVLGELEQQPELEQELRTNWVAYLTEVARPYAGLRLLQHELYQIRQEGMHLATLASWSQQVGRLDIMLKIFPALAFYYNTIGQWTDMLNIGQLALEYAQLTGHLEGIVYIETHVFCWVLSQQEHHDKAEHYINDALKVAREMGDISWQCEVLINYSQALRRRNAYDQAQKCYQQILQLVTIVTTPQQMYLRADIEFEIGKFYRDIGDWQTARAHFYAARDVFRHDESDPVFNIELAWELLSNLGLVEHKLGNLDIAEQMYLQTLDFFRELGSRGNMTTLLTRLASLEEQRGNLAAALEYASKSLDLSQRLGMVQERREAENICTRLTKKR